MLRITSPPPPPPTSTARHSRQQFHSSTPAVSRHQNMPSRRPPRKTLPAHHPQSITFQPLSHLPNSPNVSVSHPHLFHPSLCPHPLDSADRPPRLPNLSAYPAFPPPHPIAPPHFPILSPLPTSPSYRPPISDLPSLSPSHSCRTPASQPACRLTDRFFSLSRVESSRLARPLGGRPSEADTDAPPERMCRSSAPSSVFSL